MDLLQDEFIISSLENDYLILTNVRLVRESRYQYRSVRLEDIVYIGSARRNKPIIIKIALTVCTGLMGVGYLLNDFEGVKSGLILSFFIMLLAGLLYFFWLESTLTFRTSGGDISLKTDNCDYFIRQVEEAIESIKTHRPIQT